MDMEVLRNWYWDADKSQALIRIEPGKYTARLVGAKYWCEVTGLCDLFLEFRILGGEHHDLPILMQFPLLEIEDLSLRELSPLTCKNSDWFVDQHLTPVADLELSEIYEVQVENVSGTRAASGEESEGSRTFSMVKSVLGPLREC